MEVPQRNPVRGNMGEGYLTFKTFFRRLKIADSTSTNHGVTSDGKRDTRHPDGTGQGTGHIRIRVSDGNWVMTWSFADQNNRRIFAIRPMA